MSIKISTLLSKVQLIPNEQNREELLTVVKYDPYIRNRAILTLLWDLDARPHEITLLKMKHIRLKEKYGEGEIPHEAKTGAGPVL